MYAYNGRRYFHRSRRKHKQLFRHTSAFEQRHTCRTFSGDANRKYQKVLRLSRGSASATSVGTQYVGLPVDRELRLHYSRTPHRELRVGIFRLWFAAHQSTPALFELCGLFCGVPPPCRRESGTGCRTGNEYHGLRRNIDSIHIFSTNEYPALAIYDRGNMWFQF